MVFTWICFVVLQNELDPNGEEPSMSPRAPIQHQSSQPTMQFPNSGFLVSSGPSGHTTGTRFEPCDQQPKNTVFSNALSSPIRRSLQHYQIAQGGGYHPNGGSALPLAAGGRNNDPNFLQQHNRDFNPPGSNDSSMDMHAD